MVLPVVTSLTFASDSVHSSLCNLLAAYVGGNVKSTPSQVCTKLQKFAAQAIARPVLAQWFHSFELHKEVGSIVEYQFACSTLSSPFESR